MKKTNTLPALLLAPILMFGQSQGFLETYPDAAGFTGNQIVETDTGFLVFCRSANATALLTTDTNGTQTSFEILTTDPPNICTDESTACPYPNLGAAATAGQGESNFLQLFKDPDNWLRLESHHRGGCCDASSEVGWSASYAFDADLPLYPKGVVPQGDHYYIYGHQHLGEQGGGFSHSFRIWVVKTDSTGNEVWRANSNTMHSYSASGSSSLLAQPAGGGVILRFGNLGMAPNIIQFFPDGNHANLLWGGPTNIPTGGGLLFFDEGGNRFIYTTTSTPNGHSTAYHLQYLRPDGGGFSLSYPSNSLGVFAATEDGGLVLAHGDQYEPIFTIKKYGAAGSLEWSEEHPFGPSLGAVLPVGTEKAMLSGKLGGDLFLMRSGPGASYPPVDIAVTEVELPAGNIAQPGGSLAVLARHANLLGTGQSSSEDRIGFFLSENDTWDSDDLFLEDHEWGWLIPPPGWMPFYSPDIPADTEPGSYFLIVFADHTGLYLEQDEANNFFAVPLSVEAFAPPKEPVSQLLLPEGGSLNRPLPEAEAGSPQMTTDLRISDFFPFQSFLPGSSIDLDFYLRNLGTEAAENVEVEVFLRSLCDGTLLGEAVSLGTVTVAEVPANNIYVEPEIQIELPVGLAPGFYEIVTWADAAGAFAEIEECNNFHIAPIEILAQTDVELSLSSPADSVAFGANFIVTATAGNVGTDAANHLRVHLPKTAGLKHLPGFFSSASQGSFDAAGGQFWSIGSLLPGGSATLEIEYTLTTTEEVSLFAEVASSQQHDLDSAPGNGSCCLPGEDDEAVLVFFPLPPNFPQDTLAWMLGAGGDSPGSEVAAPVGLSVFPNPASEGFSVEIDLPEAGFLQIKILDLLGRQVAAPAENVFFEKGKHLLNVAANGWGTGAYWVRVQCGGAFFLRKIWKG